MGGGSLSLSTSSAEETRRLGEAMSGLLRPGDVLSLTGDLGAGKTTFVQGVAKGLGVEQLVVSPTFTLVREYEGSLPIYHLDVYRLDRIQEVLDLGFEEMIDDAAVVFVEWGEGIEALLPGEHLTVELSIPEDGDDRDVVLSATSPGWAGRWPRLADLTQPWRKERG
ncbi:MAG TPA: tRNA (adenosine(37)-N6)-threonylcarbamoyltransferase complex ATPase subunit type 1 TsaE [Actinomycetota bacterium]|nr:tRNA (adenosine(37)-N6)-threonylcarbamoyltransferase complex ATPase subunit type 1 TsaE [Actinomycetota bacterium]